MIENASTALPYAEIAVSQSLGLRQLQPEDAPALFKLVDDDREYLGEYMTWVDTIKEVSDTEEFIKDMLAKRQQGSTFGYGIIVDGELVGHTSLMHISGDEEDPEIGYWIASRMSGRGISTDVTKALIDLGFNDLSIDKILIKASVNNIGSNKIAEKVGAVLEGQESNPRIGPDLANVWAVYKK